VLSGRCRCSSLLGLFPSVTLYAYWLNSLRTDLATLNAHAPNAVIKFDNINLAVFTQVASSHQSMSFRVIVVGK
jgi:hypothetical protein